MSYWVSLWIDTGGETSAEVWSRNITSNLSRMWNEAGVPLHEWDGLEAGTCWPNLDTALTFMQSKPEAFKELNPPNGWGDYDGCVDFLLELRNVCKQHPRCTLRVSH